MPSRVVGTRQPLVWLAFSPLRLQMHVNLNIMQRLIVLAGHKRLVWSSGLQHASRARPCSRAFGSSATKVYISDICNPGASDKTRVSW